MDNATGKRLLALVRGDDYAHPGEEAANALLFTGLRPDGHRRVLDAGCGGAGTAAWVQRHGLGVVTGIELNPATARLARERHPDVSVVEGDLQAAGQVLSGSFDFIYSMTAIYAVPDQETMFGELGGLSTPGAELRILEYADPEGYFSAATRGMPTLAWWRPLAPRRLPRVLATAGWTRTTVRDLHPEFVRWYDDLCERIVAKRDEILRLFGRDWYDFVSSEYSGIRGLVRRHALGGVLVRARRAS
jgi:SAM-dependent methyltransferase